MNPQMKLIVRAEPAESDAEAVRRDCWSVFPGSTIGWYGYLKLDNTGIARLLTEMNGGQHDQRQRCRGK